MNNDFILKRRKTIKKLMTIFTIAFLSLGVFAQEDQFTTNEFPENEYETEAILMILDKKSNVPVCRLSDQVKVNSEFIPENRIGDVDTISTQDVRVCQEEDVLAAVEEEMLVGMVVPHYISPLTKMMLVIASGPSALVGCQLGLIGGIIDDNKHISVSRNIKMDAGLAGGVAGFTGGFTFVLRQLGQKIILPFSMNVLAGLGFITVGVGVGLTSEAVCRYLAN